MCDPLFQNIYGLRALDGRIDLPPKNVFDEVAALKWWVDDYPVHIVDTKSL